MSTSFQKLDPVLVCGDRRGQGLVATCFALQQARWQTRDLPAFGGIITGGNTGTDGEAFLWAMDNEIPALVVPAKWKTGDKGGGEGPARNRRMLRLVWPKAVLALPGGDGTKNMIKAALQVKLPMWRWNPDQEIWELHQ